MKVDECIGFFLNFRLLLMINLRKNIKVIFKANMIDHVEYISNGIDENIIESIDFLAKILARL